MRTPYPYILIALILLPSITAELRLDDIQFDPAIIASGDTVDIVVQFHHEGAIEDARIGNPDYRYQVTLAADDTLTEGFVRIDDAQGDDLQGIITRGGYYNKRFRVKVLDNAPAGDYEFKLTGTWVVRGTPETTSQYVRFTMPVKREGISLGMTNVISQPPRIRSGDKEILLSSSIVNTGQKDAKNVRVSLAYPDGISSSYTDDNELYIGTVPRGEERPVRFYLDTDRALTAGSYRVKYLLTYQDLDDNAYSVLGDFPVVIKKRPDIVVVASDGAARAGDAAEIRVTLRNQGQEAAEAADVRILKQASQPFELDVRSDYLGALAPGEEATAIFRVQVLDDAEIKRHTLSVLVRAKGDSAEGDDEIYTSTDAITLDVTGPPVNRWPLIAGIAAALIILAAIVTVRKRR